jgi:probable HAF family extracellular repeat protein
VLRVAKAPAGVHVGGVHSFVALALACALLTERASTQSCADLYATGGFRAEQVSGDGEVLVGSSSATGPVRAALWTITGQPQVLGTLGGAESEARDVSHDGGVVVGWADAAVGSFAFRWTAATGMQGLGTLGGPSSKANGVSRSGGVIVGEALDALGVARAFRWSLGGGMQALGSLGGASSARAVSDDGRVVVGMAIDAAGNRRAFRWTLAGGMQDLAALPGSPATEYEASAVSADGAVVVGSSLGFPPRAFRWTSALGMEDLGALQPGCGATAFDVSADGQTVVGMADELPPINLVKAFRWSPVDGMRDVGIPPGCCFITVARATGVSSDGTVIVGVDGNNESFRVQHSVVGETYCRPAVPSSSGCAGALIVRGLPLATLDTLRLEAVLLPQNSFGFFLASRAPGFAANVPNSQGNLCLAGAIGRFVGPGQIQNSGANGAFALDIDVSALPTPTGPVAAQMGETWYFQAWFRDANPNPTSNLSDAVRVLLR